jgi:NAD(P)H-hydrate epimerase
MREAFSAAAMRELDRIAIEEFGVPGAALMESAGRGVARAVRRLTRRGDHVAIVCGGGNNGGDGYVAARHLVHAERRVTLLRLAPRDRVTGDGRVYLAVLERMVEAGAPIDVVAADAPGGPAAELRGRGPFRCVVDAVFGTGLSRPVSGVYLEAIEAINRVRTDTGARVVAVDLPSGVHADTGAILGAAVRADVTTTFAARKLGLTQYPGAALAGRVVVVYIGFPPQVVGRYRARGEEPVCGVLERRDVAAALPRVRGDAHKGTFGHLVVVAGSRGHSGAAVLAARAALRMGAGLVTLATTQTARLEAAVQAPEVMTWAWCDADEPRDEDLAALERLTSGKDALALGPGVPRTAGMARIVERLLERFHGPVVVDADGLNALADAGRVEAFRVAARRLVLTPHPGEMARLAGASTADVQADRIGAAWRLARELDACVVLKGARTVIADGPAGRVAVNPTGNPGMATAGSGDVLTGAVGALLARGLAPEDAARVGVFVHGAAGDLAIAGRAPDGLIASDILEALPRALEAVCRTRR